MLYTMIQPQNYLGSEEEDFKVFLPYMVMVTILLILQKLKLITSLLQKAPSENWRKW